MNIDNVEENVNGFISFNYEGVTNILLLGPEGFQEYAEEDGIDELSTNDIKVNTAVFDKDLFDNTIDKIIENDDVDFVCANYIS